MCVREITELKTEKSLKSSQDSLNNRQPITGSLSKVLSRLAVEVRVDGEGETHTERVREGDNEETRHRVLACVHSEYSTRRYRRE